MKRPQNKVFLAIFETDIAEKVKISKLFITYK